MILTQARDHVRRDVKSTLLAFVWLTCFAFVGGCVDTVDNDDGDGSLMLVNGRIHTLDADNSVVSSVLIRGGRIVAVGDDLQKSAGGVQVIDLQGRTAIPGLVDSHIHFIRAGVRPGYDMRAIESAGSIAELQAAITARAAEIPEGAYVTGVDGWWPAQFEERRIPTLAELDAAAPNHPVYLHQFAYGPAVTNSVGKDLLEAQGIAVAENGLIAPYGDDGAVAALDLLKSQQTEEDRMRTTREVVAYANKLGLTTVLDVAGGPAHGGQRFEPDRDYEPLLELWRRKELTLRIRVSFLHFDAEVGDGSGSSTVEQRVRSTFMENSDDMFKVAGLGEQVVQDSQGPAFDATTSLAARERWLLTQHSATVEENNSHIKSFEAANDIAPIADLHWSLAHVHDIDSANLERLMALGAGVTVQSSSAVASLFRGTGGPPFRLIVDSGIAAGGGSDANAGFTMSPWFALYYMVTGKNMIGDQVNAGQSISRLEALRLYTVGSAWFSHDEDKLGSIEVGKLGDVVVLSDDYFEVTDEQIKDLTSVMTIVGGEIVYSEAAE